jgi:opacity protein-like surface antigen
MTRKVGFFMLLCLFIVPAMAMAQKAEVFGGYQYFHASGGSTGVDSVNLNGFNIAGTAFFHHYLGVTADFSGTYGTPTFLGVGVNTHLYTYMFGPELRATNSTKFVPFAHALFGGAHVSASSNFVAPSGGFTASGSNSGFAWAAGGGLDYKALPHIAIRVGQFDFLQTHISSETQNNFRYSGGVVFRF